MTYRVDDKKWLCCVVKSINDKVCPCSALNRVIGEVPSWAGLLFVTCICSNEYKYLVREQMLIARCRY